jgi:hypothetical protein
MLTAAKLEEIRKVIQDFHSGFVFSFVDPTFAPKTEVARLKAEGVIPASVSETSFPENAYSFARMMRAVKLADSTKLDFNRFLLWLKKNPTPLSRTEKNSIAYLRSKAARRIRGLGNKLDAELNTISIDTDRAAAESYMRMIQQGLATGAKNRENWKQILSDLTDRTGDYARDFHRIVYTELQDSLCEGAAIEMLKNDGEAKFAKIPRNEACRDCIRLYIDPATGKPRIFRLADLIGNSNYGLKRADWKPCIHTTHPLCLCQPAEIPDGWEFDKNWFLVPSKE